MKQGDGFLCATSTRLTHIVCDSSANHATYTLYTLWNRVASLDPTQDREQMLNDHVHRACSCFSFHLHKLMENSFCKRV